MAAQPPDWSNGRYESTAAELEPAAERLVELAAPRPGEAVLDLGTGTGNAALAAARRGARATGVDSATRLLEVARERAREQNLAEFVEGELLALPVADGSFDVALSAFGVIFAADPARALAEIARVLAPGGRALLAAWVPSGPISEMVGVLGRAVAEARGGGPPPERFPWHEPHAVEEVARAQGVRLSEVSAHDELLEIRGPSPHEYFGRNQLEHPMSIAGKPLLDRAGTFDATREQALAVLHAANEDPSALLLHSPYRVIELTGFST